MLFLARISYDDTPVKLWLVLLVVVVVVLWVYKIVRVHTFV